MKNANYCIIIIMLFFSVFSCAKPVIKCDVISWSWDSGAVGVRALLKYTVKNVGDSDNSSLLCGRWNADIYFHAELTNGRTLEIGPSGEDVPDIGEESASEAPMVIGYVFGVQYVGITNIHFIKDIRFDHADVSKLYRAP
jgi:hypothetical protein